MRTLAKNKQKLYKVSFEGTVEQTDAYGNYTGEKVRQYSSPQEVWINFRTLAGLTTSEIFGNSSDYDMTAVSNEPILQKNDLLFYELPTSTTDLLQRYDLKVEEISPSLNTYVYGFKERV